MLGGADKSNDELQSYIIGANRPAYPAKRKTTALPVLMTISPACWPA